MYSKYSKLKSILNQPLKYNQLCQALGLPIKQGNSKIAQLNNLEIYCNLEILSHPTRYIITEVYDESIDLIHANNKFQLLFEAAIYQAFLSNNGEYLYLSDLDMLKLFNEINENFPYTFNIKNMSKLGEEYAYMTPMGLTIYKILRQWTKRRFEQMKQRKILLSRDGFRLYKKIANKNKEYEYTLVTNVPINSLEEKICQEIYNQACEEIMPDNWRGEWVPKGQWENFEIRIRQLVIEYFKGQYDDMKCITIISPPSKKWINNRLEKIYKELNALEKINEESCNKILNTTQLNQHTNAQRQKFIDINIKQRPDISFKEKLKRLD